MAKAFQKAPDENSVKVKNWLTGPRERTRHLEGLCYRVRVVEVIRHRGK